MSQDSDPFDEDYQVDDAEEAEDDHLIESSEDYAGEDSYHTAAGGVTSGGEDDPEGDYFDKDINPHDLLKDMAQPAPGDNSSLQPYQILRAIRGSKNRSRRSGGRGVRDGREGLAVASDGDDDQDDDDEG